MMATQIPKEQLRDILSLADSGTWGEDANETTGSPVLRSTNIQDSTMILDEPAWRLIPKNDVERRLLKNGDILVTKSSGSADHIGKCAPFVDPCNGHRYYFSNFMLRLRADSRKADWRWLYYWLTSDEGKSELQRCNSTTSGLRNLNLNLYLSQRIPLPPLPEQKRIAAILDQADAIRRKRQQAVQYTDKLIPAIFDERFGNHQDRNGHFVSDLGNHANIVSGVTKGRRFGGQATIMLPYLRVANVQDGKLDLSEIKTVEALPSDLEKYRLQPGDVLLTEGGDHDKLGRGTLWEGQVKDCIHQNHIFRVRVDRTKLLPIFFASYIQTTSAKAYFLRCAKKTSNLATINMKQLRALPVPLPPIDEQYDFHAEVEAVRCLNQSSVSAFKQSDNLFASLVHRAFRGEL